MKVDKVAQGIANYINNGEKTQKVLRGINKNPAVFSAIASFALAGVLRPVAIGLFPFKDQEDKKCSQASALSAGLIELASTVAIFVPLNKSIEKASKSLYKSKGTFYEGNNLVLRQLKSTTNRAVKVATLIPISLARFALIKPIMDTFFKKKPKVEQATKGGKLDKWA